MIDRLPAWDRSYRKPPVGATRIHVAGYIDAIVGFQWCSRCGHPLAWPNPPLEYACFYEPAYPVGSLVLQKVTAYNECPRASNPISRGSTQRRLLTAGGPSATTMGSGPNYQTDRQVVLEDQPDRRRHEPPQLVGQELEVQRVLVSSHC